MNKRLLVIFTCLMAVSLADGFSQILHSLYFKQARHREILGPNANSLTLLNTYMGKVKYESKQNIGIIIAEQTDYDLCDGSILSKSKQENIQSIYNLEIYLFIRISGKCPFGAQVREATLLGAKGVILYDPKGNKRDHPFPEVNVDLVDIPVLIIQDTSLGKRLFDILVQDDYDGSMALCQINFGSPQKQAFPRIQYFFSSVHKQSVVFANSLYSFIKDYDPNQIVSIIPTPMVYDSAELTQYCQTQQCIEKNQNEIISQGCYSKGKYCTVHNVNYFKPSDVLDHELFQYELAKLSAQEWSKYMKTFLQECVQKAEQNKLQVDLTECGEAIIKSYNQPLLNQVLRNVRDSWLQGSEKEIDYQNMSNSSFDKIRKDIGTFKINLWPTIVINGQILQDNHLNFKEHLSKALCRSMQTPSQQCKDLLSLGSTVDSDENQNQNDQGDSFNGDKAGKIIKPQKKASVPKALVITLSLVGGLLLGGLIFYIVRRKHIREMNQLLDKKVKQAVQKYQKFNEVNTYFQELV